MTTAIRAKTMPIPIRCRCTKDCQKLLAVLQDGVLTIKRNGHEVNLNIDILNKMALT